MYNRSIWAYYSKQKGGRMDLIGNTCGLSAFVSFFMLFGQSYDSMRI